MVTLDGRRPRRPLRRCHRWLFIKHQKGSLKICEGIKSDSVPPLFCLPSLERHVTDKRGMSSVFLRRTSTIICIQRGLMGAGGWGLKAIITCFFPDVPRMDYCAPGPYSIYKTATYWQDSAINQMTP